MMGASDLSPEDRRLAAAANSDALAGRCLAGTSAPLSELKAQAVSGVDAHQVEDALPCHQLKQQQREEANLRQGRGGEGGRGAGSVLGAV